MRFTTHGVLAAILALGTGSHGFGQVKEYKGKVNQQFVLNSSSVFVNRSTGKRMSYREYDELMRRSPGQYKTEPVFDKYGKPSSFSVSRNLGRDGLGGVANATDLQPEIGDLLPPFVMEGLDGHTYDSEKLKGKYVLLGFWVRYEKPLWTLASTKVISQFIDENKRRGIEIVSLGTTMDSEEMCREAIPRRNCGFIPIPDSFGFNHRYKVAETPFFVLLDKNGYVLATAKHTEFDKIGSMRLK